MNNYFFFIVFFTGYLQIIQAVEMKIHEIYQLDVKYSMVYSCENFSLNSENGICDYRFICLEEECHSYDPLFNQTTFTNRNGMKKNFITTYCLPNDTSCVTPKCTEHTDCISNLCVNNICMVGHNSTFTECRTNVDTAIAIDHVKYQMVCGRLEFEECTEDTECAGYCKEYKEGNIMTRRCQSYFNLHKQIPPNYSLYLLI
eukprot:jgi/Orpsp1_1/1190500/evm.model.d7180000079410.1